ncbi:MAG: leucine-rich repeat protein [Clostridia bacterium]|nr:leucine-rich repeat protein [Clostridia bacterium]
MNSRLKKSLLYAFTVSLLTVLTVFSVSAKTVTKNKLVYEVTKKTATLIECKSNAKEIKVPSKVGKYKVTAIGEWAFSGKKKLKSVELPKTVTKIGEAAFNECTALKKIVIPSKVTRISSSAFWYCTNLEKAVIPASVTKFGKNVFEGCDKLTAYVVKGSKGEKYIKKQKSIKLGYRYMTSLKLDEEDVILNAGDTLKLGVTKKPKTLYNSKVSFSSSNKKVATVSSKGVITAKAKGTAVITCKAKDGSGKKAVCTVTVKAKKTEKAVSLLPAAPSAVTGLRVTAVSDSSASLSWNKANGATAYKIYLYDAADKVYTYKWAVSALKADITGLDPDKEYYFAVRAFAKNKYGSTDSASYSSAVRAKTLPGRVESITAADELIYPDGMTLSWSGVDAAEGYNLYMYSKEKKDYVLICSTAELTARVTGLRPDTDYHFRIKTYSGSEKTEGSFSRTFTFTTEYIPATAQQAAEDFLSALSATKKLTDASVITRFSTTDFDSEGEKARSVIDALELSETKYYTFTQGEAEVNGQTLCVTDVIHPYGKESTLTYADIKKDSLSFAESGSGYTVSFSLSADEAEEIAVLTDISGLREDVDGFVLCSYETGNAAVQSKITDGVLEYLMVRVPVEMTFFIEGEKQSISFTLSQQYFIG